MDSLSQNPYRLEEYLDSLDENQRQNILANKLKEWGKPQDWTLWELKLEHAFSLVLGKPLSAFDPDKEYHVYCAYTLQEHYLNLNDLKQHVDSKFIKGKFEKILNASHYSDDIFDKSKSYYSVNPEWANEAKVEYVFDESICYVLGKDLANIVEKGLVDIQEMEQAYCYQKEIEGLDEISIVYRCLSGTTLFEALYAIFFSVGSGFYDREEKGLIYKETIATNMEFEPEWEERLMSIEDIRLREHILIYFNTADSARCYGWYYEDIYKYSSVKSLISHLNGKILAHWNNTDGESFSFSIWQMDNNKAS